MELLEQPDVKKLYEKYKYIVKLWEHDFTKKHKRIPSRLDIKEASREVRYAYRKYFQIKTEALEQSFLDVDGFNSDEDNKISAEVNKDPGVNSSTTESCESSDDVQKEIQEDTVQKEPSDGVWGEHLNIVKITEKPKDPKSESKPNLNSSITKKLFCGSKFTKRNPRKSLSFSQKKSNNSISENQVFLSQPAKFASETNVKLSNNEIVDDLFKTEGFKIIKTVEKSCSQPTNFISSVLDNNYKKPLKSVDTGWLQRVASKTGAAIENPELILPTKVDYDSDDIIDGSDDEFPLSQPLILHVAKKLKTDGNVQQKFEEEISTLPQQQHPHEIVNGEESKIENEKEIPKIVTEKDTVQNEIPNILTEKSPIENEIPTILNEENALEDKIPKSKIRKKSRANVQSKRCAKPKKNKKEVVEVESPTRRSSRSNKIKVNMKEFSSGEEYDPFHSDNDENDPEFSLTEVKNKKLFIAESDDDEKPNRKSKPKAEKTNLPPKRRERKKPETSQKKSPKGKKSGQIEIEDTNAPYELEYSVKPRIVAPRCIDLKKVLTNAKKSSAVKSKKQPIEDVKQRAKSKLEQKVESGSLNENFVRIDLKKKVFARGKSNFSFSKYKKAQWKKKKKSLCGPDMDMGGCDGGELICFNCGKVGHFAQKCKATGDGLLPITAAEEEGCPYPTLEEASQMAEESVLKRRPKNLPSQKESDGDKSEIEEGGEDDVLDDSIFDDDDFETKNLLEEVEKLEENVKKLDVRFYMDSVKIVKPYFNATEINRDVIYEALNKFGHSSFRPGQEEAVIRILSGQSTLVTLSTGSGKSLCYQLPAYLYSQREPCISLVISPLVSLMEDQVTGIPSFLKAACLHTNQTKTQRDKIMDAILMGNLSVLLVSPEAVVAGEKQTGFGSLLRKLPPIAFACIDEAHCVSQWSHNFRPSYLMICRVLRESLGVQTILGLTATATRATSNSIIDHLKIPDGWRGVISDIPIPSNLNLTVSKDPQRDRALVNLLLSERFASCNSIIIYCTRRDECERIATYLRTSLKSEKPTESSSRKRKRVNFQAEVYHAGLAASRRRTIQNAFMSGELRIVVATVAFGMGINKSDIRAVIHYNMPKSFESYVQEVGRAGRDGLPAHCHLFLDSEGRDENELRRHIHANSIDRHVIRKLLQKIFIPCSCKGVCPKHEVAFSIEETVLALDIPEENISTLLCYLELHENKYIELLSHAYTVCKVISYGGPLKIRKAAKECPPLAMALALYKRKDGEDPNVLEFPVVDVASAMGWDSGICKHKLKNLEWDTENRESKRSSLSVRFSNLGFRLFAPGNLSDSQLDEALDSLYNRVVNQEQTALLQLHAVHETMLEVANNSYINCITENEDKSTNDKLVMKIREYFESPNPLKLISDLETKEINEEQLVNDIKNLVCMYRDNKFTGRAVARIFHGIQSPNYPAVIWGRCKFWRSHIGDDFHAICKIATREILNLR